MIELVRTTRSADPDSCHECGLSFIDRRYDLPGGLSLCDSCIEGYAKEVD